MTHSNTMFSNAERKAKEEKKKEVPFHRPTDTIDLNAWFRDVERVSRNFMEWYISHSKGNQAAYPARQKKLVWWVSFFEYVLEKNPIDGYAAIIGKAFEDTALNAMRYVMEQKKPEGTIATLVSKLREGKNGKVR